MINQVVLVGRTTKDLELRENRNGSSYVWFTLAVNRPSKDDLATDFIHCIAWGKTAQIMSQYVSKGMLIGIEGRLHVRSYEKEAGVRQVVSEVFVTRFTFLESRRNQENNSSSFPATEERFNDRQEFSSNNPFITATTLARGVNSSYSFNQTEEFPF